MANEYYDGVSVHKYAHNGKYYSLYKVHIAHSKLPGTLEGLSVGDQPISFQVRSEYDDSAAGQMVDKAIGAAGAGVNAALGAGPGGAAGKAINQSVGRQTIAGTISKFASTSKIQFHVEVLFFREFLTAGQSYNTIIKNSLLLVVPDSTRDGDLFGLMKPPLDYNPGDADTVKNYKEAVTVSNTISLGIGEKVMITHLICRNFTYTESVQKMNDGIPVYIKGVYEFETARVMLASEIAEWFKYG